MLADKPDEQCARAAFSALSAGRVAEARARFRSAVALAPSSPQHVMNLAKTAAYIGLSQSEAVAQLLRAMRLSIDPEAADPWCGRIRTPADYAQASGVPSIIPADLNRPPLESGRAMAFRCEAPIVLGGSFMVLPDEETLILDGMVHNRLKWTNAALRRPGHFLAGPDGFVCKRRPVRRLAGPHLLLGNDNNFGHWTWNHFTRLAYLEHIPENGPFSVIVGDDATPSMRAMLMAAGVTVDRIVEISEAEAVSPEILWVPTMLWSDYAHGTPGHWALNPGAVAFVRRFAVTGARPHRRLYLTRRNARWRRLVNEAEILPMIEKAGFEVIDPADFTFDEQRRMAGEAIQILGLFGAAMNIIAFAPASAHVGELKIPNVAMDLTPVLTHIIGQNYTALGVRTVNDQPNILHSDVICDPVELASYLERTAHAERS